MIIGNGDIAGVLTDREDMVFFASGVSNSQEMRESEFQRETELLLSQDRSMRLVYFGSLSIFYNDNRYAQHKRKMEKIVKGNFKKYAIVRIGNISWGTNPHTIINFIRGKIARCEPYEVKDVYRYVTDKDEFLYWVGLIPDWGNVEMNIPGRRMKVADIVKEYCSV